ncbi:MAG: hypothetical protein ACI8PG_003600 [Planctomycetota bacterium]|jgi:hypothetical protein
MGLSQPGRVYTNQNTQKHIKKELLFDRFDLQRVKKKNAAVLPKINAHRYSSL